MLNKTPVPILQDGPNCSIVFHHGDLDGFNGAQICQRWLEEQYGDKHEIKLVRSVYETINVQAAETFAEADEWRYIMFVDISINEELSENAPDNVYIFDHHDTSKFIQGMNDRFYWNEKYCGAVVAWRALFGNDNRDKKLLKLMKICNQYDMWQGDNGQPPKISFDMNALFWMNPTKWFIDFYDGFDGFSKEQQKLIDGHWKLQDEMWEAIDKHVYDTEKDVPHVLFLMGNDIRFDCNWWYNHLIRDEGINAVIHYRPEKDRISMRTSVDRMSWLHSGEWLREMANDPEIPAGGHKHAAGCTTAKMQLDDVILLGQKLEELCDEHFSNNKEMNGRS